MSATRGTLGRFLLSLALVGLGIMLGLVYALAVMPDPDLTTSSDPAVIAMLRDTNRIASDFADVRRRIEARAAAAALESESEALRPPAEPAAPEIASGPIDPSTRAARLAALEQWSTNEDLRKRWLFATIDDLRAWFGEPDQVSAVVAGNQQVTYWKVEGDYVTGRYAFRLTDGTVANLTYLRESTPKPLQRK